MSEQTVQGNGGAATSETHTSFSDVVRAHHRWDVAEQRVERRGSREDDAAHTEREEFESTVVRFEQDTKSTIVDAYWCRDEASGIALTYDLERESGRFGRRPRREYSLHRVTDWVTREHRSLADLLHHCDILVIKAKSSLSGIQEQVAMQWLLAIESNILGFIESSMPRDDAAASGADGRPKTDAKQLRSFERATLRELNRVEAYYLSAGHKRASLKYVQGMLFLGVPAVLMLSVLLAPVLALFIDFGFDNRNVQQLYAAVVAGAMGAVFSVLLRMHRRDFAVDHELGPWAVRSLGSFRPLIGAISGVVVALIFRAEIVPLDEQQTDINFFLVVAFLAGFSERWTRLMLGGAMRTVQPAPKRDDDEEDDELGESSA